METSTREPQEMMKVEPRKEHLWLRRLVGEWTVEGEMTMGIDKPWEKFEGTDSVRPIGDLWVLAEGHSPMPDGGDVTLLLTLGFDVQKERFVASFIASMMTYLWVYDGELDESGNKLNLYTEGPSMSEGGESVKFRESVEFVDDDHRVWTSRMQGDDGEWHELMRAHYYRKR